MLPVGAFAEISKNWRGTFEIELRGVLLSLDGRTKLEVNKTAKLSQAQTLGAECAQEVLSGGGKFLMDENAKQIGFENARRKTVSQQDKSVKTRAVTGAQKTANQEAEQPLKKRTRRSTDLISLVSTQKLAEEHLAMLRKRYRVENLDFHSNGVLPHSARGRTNRQYDYCKPCLRGLASGQLSALELAV